MTQNSNGVSSGGGGGRLTGDGGSRVDTTAGGDGGDGGDVLIVEVMLSLDPFPLIKLFGLLIVFLLFLTKSCNDSSSSSSSLESPSLFSSLSIILSELLDFFLRCLFFFGDPVSVPVKVVPVVVLGREEDGLRVDMMELNIVVLPMTLLIGWCY
jgi:hypothetical protein